MCHNNATQRACQVTRGKDAKGLNFPHPLWKTGREKQLPDHSSEENEDDEIVKLQGPTKGRESKRPDFCEH
jgi:hypothetical protein